MEQQASSCSRTLHVPVVTAYGRATANHCRFDEMCVYESLLVSTVIAVMCKIPVGSMQDSFQQVG
eukprot:3318354-Amphidinium_carterae.1